MNKIKENLSLIIVSVSTIIYLLFIFKATELREFIDLELNAKGDFLAGVFAPLAFLWLVFGYYQQGRELKLNTKALELQASELKNAVEEQRNLIKIHQEELLHKVEQAKPIFEFKKIYFDCRKVEEIDPYTVIVKNQDVSFELNNLGTSVNNVKIIRNNNLIKSIPVLKEGTPCFCSISLDDHEEECLFKNKTFKLEFFLKYTDILGKINLKKFSLTMTDYTEDDLGEDYSFKCRINEII